MFAIRARTFSFKFDPLCILVSCYFVLDKSNATGKVPTSGLVGPGPVEVTWPWTGGVEAGPCHRSRGAAFFATQPKAMGWPLDAVSYCRESCRRCCTNSISQANSSRVQPTPYCLSVGRKYYVLVPLTSSRFRSSANRSSPCTSPKY